MAADADGGGELDLEEFKVVMREGHAKFGAITKAMLTLRAMTDVESMAAMLRSANEEIEEVEVIKRLHGDSLDPAIAEELAGKRARLDERINTLNEFVSAMESGDAGSDLMAAAQAAEKAELQRKQVGSLGDYVKMGSKILKSAISGVLTVYLYFMDLISDYNVTKLYYQTGALRFAFISAALIIGQFAVVWNRVLPYLRATYGDDSAFYPLFLYAGMPFGCFIFDFLVDPSHPHASPTRRERLRIVQRPRRVHDRSCGGCAGRCSLARLVCSRCCRYPRACCFSCRHTARRA